MVEQNRYNDRMPTRVGKRQVVLRLASGETTYGEMLNLGVNGMFIRGVNLANDDEFTFRFYIEELSHWIEGSGVVCWHRQPSKEAHFPSGYGVHFKNMSRMDKRLLSQFLQVHKSFHLIDRLVERRGFLSLDG